MRTPDLQLQDDHPGDAAEDLQPHGQPARGLLLNSPGLDNIAEEHAAMDRPQLRVPRMHRGTVGDPPSAAGL